MAYHLRRVETTYFDCKPNFVDSENFEYNSSAHSRIFKMTDWVHNLLKFFWSKLSLPSTMNDKEQDEELCIWIDLPSDILEMIMKRLKLIDYLRIRGVCSTWRATITNAIANNHCQSLPELPLVFLRSRNKFKVPSRFFNISTEKAFSLKSKSTLLDRNPLCHGTVGGWMILSENLAGGAKAIYFLNPGTEDVVKVPSPLNLPSKSPIFYRSHLSMGKMVASSSPKCKGCVVVGRFTDYAHIAYCRVNSDKPWTVIEAKNEDTGYVRDVEIFNDKLYVRTDRSEHSILVYDLQDSMDDPPKPIVLGMIPPIRPLRRSNRHGNRIHVKNEAIGYLTRGYASEELLLIYLLTNYVYEANNVGRRNVIKKYVSPPQITKYEVFKLDKSNNKWVKLDHLGDRVIFLGNFKSFVMSRAALNSTKELIAENTIYFAHYTQCSEKPWPVTQLGRIYMTGNSVKHFCLEQFGHELNVYPFWFLPSAC